MAAGQVIQAGVGNQGAVVQLQHNQVLTGAGRQAQVPGEQKTRNGGMFLTDAGNIEGIFLDPDLPDCLVSYELAVRE